jgi:hypothetical protein
MLARMRPKFESKRNTIDPLEAAKVPTQESAAAAEAADLGSDDNEAPPATRASDVERYRSAAARESLDRTLAAPAPAGERVKVDRRITVSMGHQLITLNPGDVLSSDSLPDGFIARVREAGAVLVTVD